MNARTVRAKVGELRPSQMLFTFGVGSLVDLPHLSVIVLGLDDWNTADLLEIGEDRLLAAVRAFTGQPVERLCLPPLSPDSLGPSTAFSGGSMVGVPVAPFPRWVRCPRCDLLGPLTSGIFELKVDQYHPESTRYVHANCPKAQRPPAALPVRFLVACENGHIDDFPWVWFAHRGAPCGAPILRMREFGVSGEASDVDVRCDTCQQSRRVGEAFGEEGRNKMPMCRGRRAHLRDLEENGCDRRMKSILLGASNSWFPVTLSALSVPVASNKLAQLVDENWVVLGKATTPDVLTAFRGIGQLSGFSEYGDDDLWKAVEAKRNATVTGDAAPVTDLTGPEWRVFSQPDPTLNSSDFLLNEVPVPDCYQDRFTRVLLVERLREVRALTGFTRIASPGEFADVEEIPAASRVPLTRKSATWVPAVDIRGEGIFVQFDEQAVRRWTDALGERDDEYFAAHRQWRHVRNIPNEQAGYPGLRYVLLHSFSHALMRQLALECGYTAASIRERIYSRNQEEEDGPMAGLLLYTAAPDSEGTLGGLVHLGTPERLGPHIDEALHQMRLCASDPLCAGHRPLEQGITLHGAACHACLFAPETSCERGNRYLDRTLLVPTFGDGSQPFFTHDGNHA